MKYHLRYLKKHEVLGWAFRVKTKEKKVDRKITTTKETQDLSEYPPEVIDQWLFHFEELEEYEICALILKSAKQQPVASE